MRQLIGMERLCCKNHQKTMSGTYAILWARKPPSDELEILAVMEGMKDFQVHLLDIDLKS